MTAVSSLGLMALPARAPSDFESHIGTTLDTATWDSGRVLQTLEPGNVFATLSLPPGTHIIMARAKDTSGNYSTNVAKIEFTVTNQNHVIFGTGQSPDWPGTMSGFVRHWVSGSLVPDSQTLAADGGWNTFDSFVQNPVPVSVYVAPEIDIGGDFSNLRVWSNIVTQAGPGVASVNDPIYTVDYRKAAGIYDGYEIWSIGKIDARYVKQRVVLDNSIGAAALKRFEPFVDAQDRKESFTDKGIAAGGTRIYFANSFVFTPNVKITPQGSGLIGWFDNKTTAYVDVHLDDRASGSDVGGTADIEVTGV